MDHRSARRIAVQPAVTAAERHTLARDGWLLPRRRGLRPRLLAAVVRSKSTLAFAAERQVVSRTRNMKQRWKILAYTGAVGLLLSPLGAYGASVEVVPLEGQQANTLASVTGMRSVLHEKSGFVVRLLEADGSASVAQDPIALFLVVTSDGTSNLQGHVWRLPHAVDRVRKLSATMCRVDASVDVDGPAEPIPGKPSPKPVSRVFHLCFLAADGQLLSKLQFSDEAAKRAG